MTWSTATGLLVLSASFYAVSSATVSATETSPMQLDQEAIGITYQGGVRRHENKQSLMRTENAGEKEDVNADIGNADETKPEQHRHHVHNQEHQHGKHRHHHSAHQADEEDAKGFSSMDTDRMHIKTQDNQDSEGAEDAADKHEAKEEVAGDEAGQHLQVPHGAELTEADSEFLPALGLSNPSDLAYRAMDMMMGIASIIPEDYPYVCICLDTGVCDENMPEDKKTACPSRIGQKSGAAHNALGAALFAAVFMGMHA